MKNNLLHILDKSTCLNSRQMKDYINNCVSRDECRAVEHHLNHCPLCSEAIDGIMAADIAALEELSGMDKQFFRDRIIPPTVIEANRPAARRKALQPHHKSNTVLIALIATSAFIILVVTMLKEFIRL